MTTVWVGTSTSEADIVVNAGGIANTWVAMATVNHDITKISSPSWATSTPESGKYKIKWKIKNKVENFI